MKKMNLIIYLSFILLSACQFSNKPTDFVDPFIGTGGHGHTFPGATVPFGMVQLSPDTRLEGWDGCSGYHYSDSIIYGFSHTHLSGTGVADYCDILFMPTAENFYLKNGYKENIENGYGSRFNKETEKTSPGFYSVTLDDYGINVKLTSTNRVGFHKYTFPKNKNAFVTIDLTHRDEVLESSLKQISEYEIEGMRRSQSWAKDQYIYFVARFNQPIKHLNLAINDTINKNLTNASGKNTKAALDFGKLSENNLMIKVGISSVSEEGARKNLNEEIPHWDFEKVKNEAQQKWNTELSKINIKSDKENKVIFYSALYHTMIAPNTFMDVDGKYRGTDLKVHQANDFTNYTIFSLWDTYRATHPLYTIIDQERTSDFIKTFINQYINGGQLPVWELAGNYTGCMIGYHSIPVIADAYAKGIRNYDIEKAYEAMKHSAMQDHLGLEAYKNYGYVPAHNESESVSKTLEYAYDDWCIAEMAKDLNYTEDYNYYIRRAQSYKNVYDPQTGFMRPKAYGAWKHPFDPTEVDFNFTEANSWQYSFYAPQDITGLISLMGGKENFSNKLDELFSTEEETSGRHQSDITGLIGQYAHGNEPSHHMAYLYSFVNKTWKTQEMTSQILNEMYSTNPDGYIGNEDCGQMSAWYVLSAMGFYPVTPASNIYVIGSPILKEATINLENGKLFVIKTKNLTNENKYIQSATLNGVVYNKSFIEHKTIMSGGDMIFEMGNTPNKEWGTQEENIPIAEINDNPILPIPYSNASKRSFTGTIDIELYHQFNDAKIYFTIDGNEPTENSGLYKKPISITKTSTIKYFAELDGKKTAITELSLIKFPEGRSIQINTRPHRQYTAGGDSALIDGVYGENDFRTGSWQGYNGYDLNAIVDLGKSTTVSYLSINFLQDINSWIFMPEYVEYFISNDGENFVSIGKVRNTTPEDQWESTISAFTLKVYPKETRYIKVLGKSGIMCPEWHKGRGHELHIFADEITIK
ncbi:MAG: GH92 family glycosyl hydrolase [Bacteroidales bacterium]|nr:GH92 family glycosyl hydrolase [Bacteroidales bacterium]